MGKSSSMAMLAMKWVKDKKGSKYYHLSDFRIILVMQYVYFEIINERIW